jgi:hypothetical protein
VARAHDDEVADRQQLEAVAAHHGTGPLRSEMAYLLLVRVLHDDSLRITSPDPDTAS